MNVIKYAHSDGRTARVKISQPSYRTLIDGFNGTNKIVRGLPTMAEADDAMHRRGFHRAGRRWKKAA